VRRSAGVEDPVGGAGRRIEGDCAEGVGEGLRVPQGRSRGRRLVERRVEGARGCRVEEAGRRKVGHHGLWRGRADARRPTDAAGGGVGPHVDGPGPQIEERGPLCLAGGTVVRAALVGVRAALAGVRATVFAGRAASGRWSRRARGPGARGGGGGGRGGGRLAGGGDDGRSGRCGRCHVELGKAKVGADVGERWERPLASDKL
jgi:hypothetical protein